MKKKQKVKKVSSCDVHFGDVLRPFKVRCAREQSFVMKVMAHDEKEAALVAEEHCINDLGMSFWWADEAQYEHHTFEVIS